MTSTGDVVDPSTANNSLLGDDYIYVKTTDDLYEILGNNNKAGTAEDGAYVVLQKGVHVLDHSKEGNGQLSVTIDLTIVGEDGAQIKGGYYTNTSSSRPFYIYCSSVENLVIKNIDFIKGDGQDQCLAELWFSGSEADYMKGNPDSQKIKVLLDNVGVEQVRLENYFGYQKGLVMDVTINGCNIGTVMIENWGNGNKTYFTYDSGSEINLRYNLVNDGEESVFVNMIK